MRSNSSHQPNLTHATFGKPPVKNQNKYKRPQSSRSYASYKSTNNIINVKKANIDSRVMRVEQVDNNAPANHTEHSKLES